MFKQCNHVSVLKFVVLTIFKRKLVVLTFPSSNFQVGLLLLGRYYALLHMPMFCFVLLHFVFFFVLLVLVFVPSRLFSK